MLLEILVRIIGEDVLYGQLTVDAGMERDECLTAGEA
jgi:hypothetical protein